MKPSTKAAHAELPWFVSEGFVDRKANKAGETYEPGWVGIGNGTVPIARANINGTISPEEARANAEFIIRACNSFGELLEAAKKALEGLQEGIDREDIAEVLAAAIVKAEER